MQIDLTPVLNATFEAYLDGGDVTPEQLTALERWQIKQTILPLVVATATALREQIASEVERRAAVDPTYTMADIVAGLRVPQ